MLNDVGYDDKLMFTCHRYGGPATKEAIAHYINFRDSVNRPMYMGEFGHNTMEWQRDFVKVLKENNIGYTFWPYKKVDESCMMGIKRPEGWDSIVVKYSIPIPNGARHVLTKHSSVCSSSSLPRTAAYKTVRRKQNTSIVWN